MSELSTSAASAEQRRARTRARLADAARLLPVLALVLFLAPDLILSGGPAAKGATAPALGYLFLAWFGLIALAGWIARSHANMTSAETADAAQTTGAAEGAEAEHRA